MGAVSLPDLHDLSGTASVRRSKLCRDPGAVLAATVSDPPLRIPTHSLSVLGGVPFSERCRFSRFPRVSQKTIVAISWGSRACSRVGVGQ